MHLHFYTFLFGLAILASLFGALFISIPCAVMGGGLAFREPLLGSLGSLVRVKPIRLDSSDAPPAKL